MSQAYNFLKEQEADLVKVIGEKDWKSEKVYFVDEIIEFMEEYEKFLNKKDKRKKGNFSNETEAEIKRVLELGEELKSKLPIVDNNKFNEAVEYVQENYCDTHLGIPYLLLGNVAELIKMLTGQEIHHSILSKQE